MAKNFSYLKRTFLNPISSTKNSFIFAQVENSIHGSDRGIENVLQIADCDKPAITLDFYLGTARHRRESLAKVDLLTEIVTGFRDALHAEAKLIEKDQKSKKD